MLTGAPCTVSSPRPAAPSATVGAYLASLAESHATTMLRQILATCDTSARGHDGRVDRIDSDCTLLRCDPISRDHRCNVSRADAVEALGRLVMDPAR